MFWCRVYVHIAFSFLPALVIPTPVPLPVRRAYLGLNRTILRLVRDNAANISTQSWERGTLAEALTEAEWPRLTPFMPNTLFPPPQLPWYESAYDVLSIAETTINNKTNTSAGPLVDGDGSVGDPASLGQSVLLYNWTRTNLSDTRFSFAAGQQLGYLLNQAPRSRSGAISHRVNEVALWADFVYMAPPFIAYFGALQNDSGGLGLMQIAYDQIRLYRDALFDRNVSLWRHIANGSSEDIGHWGTGNGWAAAGMMRVWAIINRSSFSSQMQGQKNNLTQWIDEILTGVWKYQQPNGTLLNYVDQPDSFADSASTALLAATTFRYSLLTYDGKHDLAAMQALSLVWQSIDQNGWLLNIVDPETFTQPLRNGAHSPEAQSFVLLLAAAWAVF